MRLDLENPTKPSNYVDRGIVRGTPLVWRDDMSGNLQMIILAFFQGSARDDQIETLIKYVIYYLNAPCWTDNPGLIKISDEYIDEFNELRKKALEMKTKEDLDAVIKQSIELGVDPL